MKIGFIGGGKMAEGILCSLLKSGERTGVAPSDLLVADKAPERCQAIAQKYCGVSVTGDIRDVVGRCEMLFLAVRPQDVDDVARSVGSLLRTGQTLVSIVAGKTLAALEAAFGDKARIVRVMPNLALRVGEGMCAVCGNGADEVCAMLSAAGKAVVLDERHFDAVTALSGSGPAYFAYMEKAMSEAGEALGLPHDVARLLAEQTMYGTAKFLRESGADLDEFISGVCTKGGTTAAGMEIMAASDFKAVVAGTLAAAAERSRQLA